MVLYTAVVLCLAEQDQSRAPIMKFQQQQQQTHSDSSKMN
eukprot:COSAG01_NODE_26896_length_700_cov_0.830283_2_plen_39_part_01